MKYLLDANVFIQAHRIHYPMDIFPGFWQWLEDNIGSSLFTVSEIYEEMKAGQDDLWDWIAVQDKESWILNVDDEETQSRYWQIANWIEENQQFSDPAKSDFLRVADPWLIAKAMTNHFTIVTQEKSAPNSRTKIHIPDVCKQFDVSYIDTIQLMRDLRGSF